LVAARAGRGSAWIVIAIVILRFDFTTVVAIAILFGRFMIGAEVHAFMVGTMSVKNGWRLLHWLLESRSSSVSSRSSIRAKRSSRWPA